MVHDGRWRGVRSSGGRGRRPNPLTSRSPFCFVIWGGGLVHWCWWTCTIVHGSRKGRWQGRLSALSANTHTRRVAVKRVDQILKLPLSPLYNRKGKRRFSPWVTFFPPGIHYSSVFLRGNGKVWVGFFEKSWFVFSCQEPLGSFHGVSSKCHW